jgi:hypothetical protein
VVWDRRLFRLLQPLAAASVLVYQTLAEVCFQTATARQKQMAVIKSTLAAKGK